jgi:hypothetical protein
VGTLLICSSLFDFSSIFCVERLKYEQLNPTAPASEFATNEDPADDGLISGVGDATETGSVISQSSTRVSSVSSLLALKRGKLEHMRRATINAATAFATSSRNDAKVNSMRTLTMINSRIVGVKYDGEQIM